MFLRGSGASWSTILLRDELLHAGIRHCRTLLKPANAAAEPDATDGDGTAAPLAGLSREAPSAAPSWRL